MYFLIKRCNVIVNASCGELQQYESNKQLNYAQKYWKIIWKFILILCESSGCYYEQFMWHNNLCFLVQLIHCVLTIVHLSTSDKM